MSIWRVEWLRLFRTRRWIALVAVFLLLGLTNPLVTKYLGQLLSNSTGGESYIHFTVTQPLKFSLTGGISLTEQMGNLAMTSDAVTAFQQGLSLPKAVTLLLPTINFGTIDAKIVPWIRSTPLKAVPEPSTYAILGVGLAAAGLTLRRRQSA